MAFANGVFAVGPLEVLAFIYRVGDAKPVIRAVIVEPPLYAAAVISEIRAGRRHYQGKVSRLYQPQRIPQIAGYIQRHPVVKPAEGDL